MSGWYVLCKLSFLYFNVCCFSFDFCFSMIFRSSLCKLAVVLYSCFYTVVSISVLYSTILRPFILLRVVLVFPLLSLVLRLVCLILLHFYI